MFVADPYAPSHGGASSAVASASPLPHIDAPSARKVPLRAQKARAKKIKSTGAGDQLPSSPSKRKTRGGKKFDKFDKVSPSESGAPAVATSVQPLNPLIDKEMCSLEMWLECSSDHLEGPNCSMDKPLALAGLRSVKNVRPLVGKLSEVKQLLDTCFQTHAEGCVLPRSCLLRLRRIAQLAACRSYRCIVAGTRFPCPYDPPLVCGILDHWIAELQPHTNKRDPVLSRLYNLTGRLPWQRSLSELLPVNSLPQSLENFCDSEHIHDSVVFNSLRSAFKDTCDQMLAKLRPSSESSDRQQELAAWMAEGLKEFAPRSKFVHVGSCPSGLDTSDSDLNMLMLPHDPQLFERKDGLDFLHNFSKHLKKRTKPAHFSTLMAYTSQTPYALSSRITCKISGATGPATDVDCTIIVGDQSHIARCTLLKLYSECDPRVRQLVALVKAWAFSRYASIDVRWKNSYAWTLMTVAFLQSGISPPILPCIHASLSPELAAQLVDNPEHVELMVIASSPLPSHPRVLPAHALMLSVQALVSRERAALIDKHGRNDVEVADLVVSFFHYFSCVFDFEMWALSVQTGQPILKSSISGASFPPNVVVILDPIDGNHNSLGNFVVETADAMRVELYRVFQVARHTSRILPVSGESSDDSGPAVAVSSMPSGPPLPTDAGAADAAATAAAALPAKSLVASALGATQKLASNQLPPNILAELQDTTGLFLGVAVATIKRNAQGVVTGFRDCKSAKPGDSIMRRYEVQVRLTNDGSSVYLYPDQLNVLGPNPKQIQQQPQVAVQRPLLPGNESRTLDASVVDAAVRNIAAIVARTGAEGGSCTLTQLHKANPAYRGGSSSFSHDDDARASLDALELLLRAHDHVFVLRPLFDKGDFQVQLVTQPTRSSSGSAAPALNPAAPNFSVNRFPVSLGDSQMQQSVLPPSSRAHLWHEMSGKVVQQQHQQDRWN